ncbi:MAG: PBP1A family penicillin-binding protein, partial [Prochlorococcaceae cyanobacterium]
MTRTLPTPSRPSAAAVARGRGGSRRLVVTAVAAAVLGGGVAAVQSTVVGSFDSLLPDASGISNFNRPGTLTILSADGQVLQKLGPLAREKLSSGAVPPLVEQAFIAAEDRRFYRHRGVDLQGILRATGRNISRGSVEEGASTITQQLARTVFLSQDLTITRKLKEAALAGKLERQLSKREILTEYLNLVYLGSSAYGVADAAWIYFSKTPEQLTLPEAAMIAGLPPAPSVYSPLVNPELALQRRRIVLSRMRQQGFISTSQQLEAEGSPLGLKPADPKYWESRAPYFGNWVQQELATVLSNEQLEVGGLTVRSSINLAWQDEAEKTIRAHATGSLQGALVAIEPGTGLVRAMVGGKDFNASQFNRATQALRSPGSTFKLFTYAAALEAGLKPEDTVDNKERCIKDGWPPKTFCIKGAKAKSTTSISNAIAQSLNAASVDLAEKVGYDKVVEIAKTMGMVGDIGEYPSMVLGANEQYALDMAAAYAAITNRGVFVKPTPFEEIYGPDGELLWSRRVDGHKGMRVLRSEVADALQWMLQQVVSSGTGRPASLPDRPVAGKTGTSEGARDLWFVGSIPQLTTAIWLGYDGNRKTGSSSAAATYAWRRFMEPISKTLPVQQFPPKPVLTGSFKKQEAKPKPKPKPAPKPEDQSRPETERDSWSRPESDDEEPTPIPEPRWTPEPSPEPAVRPDPQPAPRPSAPSAPAPAP